MLLFPNLISKTLIFSTNNSISYKDDFKYLQIRLGKIR